MAVHPVPGALLRLPAAQHDDAQAQAGEPPSSGRWATAEDAAAFEWSPTRGLGRAATRPCGHEPAQLSGLCAGMPIDGLLAMSAAETSSSVAEWSTELPTAQVSIETSAMD